MSRRVGHTDWDEYAEGEPEEKQLIAATGTVEALGTNGAVHDEHGVVAKHVWANKAERRLGRADILEVHEPRPLADGEECADDGSPHLAVEHVARGHVGVLAELEVVGVDEGVVDGLGAEHAEVLHGHRVAAVDEATEHEGDRVERRLLARHGGDDTEWHDEDEGQDRRSQDYRESDGSVDAQAEHAEEEG